VTTIHYADVLIERGSVVDNTGVHRLLRGEIIQLYTRLRGVTRGFVRARWGRQPGRRTRSSGRQALWRWRYRGLPYHRWRTACQVRQWRVSRVPWILGVLQTNTYVSNGGFPIRQSRQLPKARMVRRPAISVRKLFY